jgi:hypothetical protein
MAGEPERQYAATGPSLQSSVKYGVTPGVREAVGRWPQAPKRRSRQPLGAELPAASLEPPSITVYRQPC